MATLENLNILGICNGGGKQGQLSQLKSNLHYIFAGLKRVGNNLI